jgi:hypothetical protein
VPSLRLTLPVVPALPNRESTGLWPRYWQEASVPREWRSATDDELRLDVETGRWQAGRLSVSTEISTVPARERNCREGDSDCRAPAWSSALRLKYQTGDIGPLRETGPELKVLVTPPRPGVRGGGLLQGGFGGKF